MRLIVVDRHRHDHLNVLQVANSFSIPKAPREIRTSPQLGKVVVSRLEHLPQILRSFVGAFALQEVDYAVFGVDTDLAVGACDLEGSLVRKGRRKQLGGTLTLYSLSLT